MASSITQLIAQAEKHFKRKEYLKTCSKYKLALQHRDAKVHRSVALSCLRNIAVCYTNMGDMRNMVETFERILEEKDMDVDSRSSFTAQLRNNIGWLMVSGFREEHLPHYATLSTHQRIAVVMQLLDDPSRLGHCVCIVKHAFDAELIDESTGEWDDCVIHFVRTMCTAKEPRLLELESGWGKRGWLYYCGISKYWRGDFEAARMMFSVPSVHSSAPSARKVPLTWYRSSSTLRSITVYHEDVLRRLESDVNAALKLHISAYPANMDRLFFQRHLLSIHDVCTERLSPDMGISYTQQCAEMLQWTIRHCFDDHDDCTILNKVDDFTQIVGIKEAVVHTRDMDMIVSKSETKDPLGGKRSLILGGNTHTNSELLRNKKLKPPFSDVQRIEGRVFVTTITVQSNHYHVVCEILTRLSVLLRNGISGDDVTLLLCSGMPASYKDILRRMGFSKITFYHPQFATYLVDELLFVDMVASDSEFRDGWDCYLPSAAGLKSLRSLTLSLFAPKDEEQQGREKGSNVVFISRGDQGVRHVHGEDTLIRDVLRPLYGKDLVVFDDEYISSSEDPFVSQIRLFADARLIIAPHGAGLTNILFSSPGTPVVEFTMRPQCNRCFEYVAKTCDLEYHPCDVMQSFYHGHYEYDDEKGLRIRKFLIDVMDKHP